MLFGFGFECINELLLGSGLFTKVLNTGEMEKNQLKL
jgi:hypothetical protein